MATGLTDKEEWALEKSAMEAFEKCGFDPQPEDDLGEWELALWTDYSTILVHRGRYLAAVITRDGAGSYTTDNEGRITIDLPITTMMACPPEAQQDDFIKDLTSVQMYLLQDGNLHLMLPFDSGTISFAPAPAE